jgi:two-component system, NtrC family, sensor kinase
MTEIQYPPGVFLYFVYGLAFILLGGAIAVKDMSESKLKLASSLPSLAIFGLTHGLHEWLLVYLLLVHGETSDLLPIHYLKLLTMVISFLFLNHFGICLLRSQPKIRWQWLRVLIPFLLLSLGMYLWLMRSEMNLELLRKADILARLTIGSLGGGLAGFALIRHSRVVKSQNGPVALSLRWAGIGFAIYAVLAGIVPSHFVIPVLDLPIEVLRGAAAVMITYFMVRALNIFNVETRKKLEQQLRRLTQAEKLAALGKLAAGIAHEINNPLSNISLNVEMLRKEIREMPAPDRLEKRFDAIERNIARASKIARELLDFSSQRDADPMTPVNLNALVEGALTLLGSRRHTYAITTRLRPLPPIMAVPYKVEEVLLNVLLNAMEASPPTGRITISTRSEAGRVVAEIADQGSGIAPEHLDHVLEPFYTTKEVGQGTGLGLSICYNIMESHQGKIALSSTAGVGTTVSLIFPVAEEESYG